LDSKPNRSSESKTVGLIIQARMGSSRLPGKSMMSLAGKPLVGRILERVLRCSTIDVVILAIPGTPENEPLKALAHDYGVSIFMGDENDVLARYYEAAISFGVDLVVRLPADNCVPEPKEIDKIVEHHLSLGIAGFSSNLAEVFGSGYPDGIGAEVFDFDLLETAHKNATDPVLREHVHLNFFDYDSQKPVDEYACPVSTIVCPKEYRRPDIVLDVNTLEQYRYMSKLYDALYTKNNNFGILDVIDWHDTNFIKD